MNSKPSSAWKASSQFDGVQNSKRTVFRRVLRTVLGMLSTLLKSVIAGDSWSLDAAVERKSGRALRTLLSTVLEAKV